MSSPVTPALLQPVMRKILEEFEDFKNHRNYHRNIAQRAVKDAFCAIGKKATWSFNDMGVMGIAAVAFLRNEGIAESVRVDCCYAILALACVLNYENFGCSDAISLFYSNPPLYKTKTR